MSIGVKVKKTDGTWGGGAAKPNQVDTYTSSQNVTKPDGARYLFYEGISGGGGGINTGGLHGAGGGYISMLFACDGLSASEPLTIGAGGVSGDGGATTFHGLSISGGAKGSSDSGLPSSYGGGINEQGSSNKSSAVATGLLSVGGFGINLASAANSGFGAGGAPVGIGGTQAAAFGALKAGNGGATNTAGSAPGGGGGGGTSPKAGAPGAARFTWIF